MWNLTYHETDNFHAISTHFHELPNNSNQPLLKLPMQTFSCCVQIKNNVTPNLVIIDFWGELTFLSKLCSDK